MKNHNQTKKLNLGCGKDYKQGFVNVDIRADVGADLVHDVTKPFPLRENSVSEVIAQDVFEHLTKEQQSSLFRELFRLLSKSGTLHVRIPNNEDIWERFSNDPDTRNLFLFGDTSESGIWGSHKSGHTPSSFAELAAISGFRLLKYSAVDTNYEFEYIKDSLPRLKGVVFINQTLGMGGAENFNTQLLSWLKRNKVPVKAWSTHVTFNKYLTSQGISAGKIPFVVDGIGDWKGLIKGILLFPAASVYYAYLTFKNRKSGTIVMSGFIEKILVTPWAKLLNIPVVWIDFGPWQTIFSKFFGLPRVLYRAVSKLPDFVIEPSENTRIKNLNITGISTAKTKIIPCGINPLKSVPSTPKKLTAYCVSRMELGKGQDLLIKAWRKVVTRFPSAHLYLIGEGDFRRELEQLVRKMDLTGSVTFLGRVDNLAKEISSISLGIFPSVWPLEGFGLVLLEAMSMRKPVVSFDAGPYPEILNSDCSIVVDKGNIDELSKAILRIFSEPKLARRLGGNGKKRFNKYFTINKIAPQYGTILLEAQILCQIRKTFPNIY